MAAHAPRGAENDLPQARPVRIFFDFFRIFCRHGADIGLFNEFCRDLGVDIIGDFFRCIIFPGGRSDQPQSDLPLVALSQLIITVRSDF